MITQRLMKLNVALASLAFAACVTINVYFPAAAAEKAADQIIDTVTSGGSATGAPGSTVPKTAPAAPPVSSLRGGATADELPVLLVAAGRVLELLVPAAHAQAEANLDVSSPGVRAVTASMQARWGELEKYFASGAVGMTTSGLIELRDQGLVPIAERATAKRLVSEDNNDRNTLYAEIAKANGHPEWEADIRRIFAQRWVQRAAQPGWYYQDASGTWKQK